MRSARWIAGVTGRLREEPRLLVLLAVLAALATGSVVGGLINAFEDSRDMQWHEARLLLGGFNPYALHLDGAETTSLTGSPDSTEPVQLPSVLLMFVPLALMEIETARRVWLAVNLVATAAFLALSLKLFFPGRVSAYAVAVFGLLFLASTPWRVTLGNGQHGLVAMVFFLVAFSFFERRRLVAAGLFASLALFKYILVLPFFALLLYRWRDAFLVIVSALAVHVALTLLVGAMTGADPLLLVRQSLEVASTISTNGTFDFFAFFAWAAPGAGMALPLVCSAAVIAATLMLARERLELRGLAILSIVSIIIAYHRIYDAFVLVFLALHLYAMVRQKPAPDGTGRFCWGGRLEFAGGVLVLAYVFFLDRIVLELMRWQVLSFAQRETITAAASVVIYGYLALLFLRARRSTISTGEIEEDIGR